MPIEVYCLVHIKSDLYLNGSVDGVPATSLGNYFIPTIRQHYQRFILSFPLLGCLSLPLLRRTRWSIHGKSFPSRRFHSSLYDCQECYVRSGVSSLAPRSLLCCIYSLSVPFFMFELQGRAATPANHCCSAAKAEALT